MAEEEESLVLQRLRRISASLKESTATPLAVEPAEARLCLGANACLRALRKRKLSLVIIPIKQSAALVEQLRLSCLAAGLTNETGIWYPEISPKEFGKILGLPNTCAMAGFPLPVDGGEGELDLLVGVRRTIEEILKQKSVGGAAPSATTTIIRSAHQGGKPKMQRLSSTSTS